VNGEVKVANSLAWNTCFSVPTGDQTYRWLPTPKIIRYAQCREKKSAAASSSSAALRIDVVLYDNIFAARNKNSNERL